MVNFFFLCFKSLYLIYLKYTHIRNLQDSDTGVFVSVTVGTCDGANAGAHIEIHVKAADQNIQ